MTMIIEAIAALFFVIIGYVVCTLWENKNLPPGPFPLPVLGNLLSVGLKQPYRDLANMTKKYGKLFRIQMGRRKVIVINSYDIAREALVAKAEDFAGRPHHFFGSLIFGRNSTGFAFQTFSQRWKTQRKIALTALRLTEDKANVASHVDELCDKFHSSKGNPFCPRDLVFKSLGICLSSLIFGEENKLHDHEIDALIEVLHVFEKSLGAANFIDTFPILKNIPFDAIKKARRAGEVRDEIFKRKFEEHNSTFQSDNIRDLIDAMLKGFRENSSGLLTEEHLISSASDVFFPGTATPSVVITWLIFYVIKYPNVQARLHSHLDDVFGNTNRLPQLSDKPNLTYLDAFIAEVQRIVSDSPLAVPHSTTRDTSLAGFFIPRDTTVFVNLWAIHHDSDRWEDPFCFRPERFLDEQGRLRLEGIMPFSSGKRSCPGESFARKAVFLYAARLLYRFQFQSPPGAILPDEDESDYGIVLSCKPFKICAIERRNKNLLTKK